MEIGESLEPASTVSLSLIFENKSDRINAEITSTVPLILKLK